MKRFLIFLLLFFSVKHDMLLAEGVFTRHLETRPFDIAIEKDLIWCATESGAIRFNKLTGETTRYTKKDGLGSDALYSVAIDREGIVWFGHIDNKNSGVSWFDGNSWFSKSFPDSLHSNFTESIAVDRDNRKVFGVNACILQFDGSEWSVLFRNGGAEAVFYDSGNILWAVSSNHLKRYDGNVWEYVLYDSSYDLTSINEDKNHVL
jgi:hypothetical protein